MGGTRKSLHVFFSRCARTGASSQSLRTCMGKGPFRRLCPWLSYGRRSAGLYRQGISAWLVWAGSYCRLSVHCHTGVWEVGRNQSRQGTRKGMPGHVTSLRPRSRWQSKADESLSEGKRERERLCEGEEKETYLMIDD